MRTIDLGNNESGGIGMEQTVDGWLAITLTESRTFKTFNGAARWLARRGYKPDGSGGGYHTVDPSAVIR